MQDTAGGLFKYVINWSYYNSQSIITQSSTQNTISYTKNWNVMMQNNNNVSIIILIRLIYSSYAY